MNDLRMVVPERQLLRCALSELEVYEVRFKVSAKRGNAGDVLQMQVFRSLDGARTWSPIRFRRDWRQWWAIAHRGLGGSTWPPAGEDVRGVSIKNGMFAMSYCNLQEHGPDGQAYVWEMLHDSSADRWRLALLEEVT